MRSRLPEGVDDISCRLGVFARDRQGGIAIILALSMPVLIAGLAFGAEVGFWQMQQRKLQNAADTAAHAAGTQLRLGVDNANDLKPYALAVAESGGYMAGNAGITVETPPSSGAYAGDSDAVRVTLDHSIPRNFSGIFSPDPVQFTVASTALVSNGRPACILSLHPSASAAVTVGGSASLTLTGCDIAANSISSSAVDTGTGSGSSINVDCVWSVGGVDDSHGNISYTECSGPNENAPKTPDPYEKAGEPFCGAYQSANAFTNAGNPSRPGTGVAGSVNCYQNVNGISRNIVLEPDEIYVLRNSNISLTGNKSISGEGVLIFLTGSSSLSVGGNATIDVSAAQTGPYAGIAIYGDRDNEIDMDLTGNTGVSIVGAVYAPNKNSDVKFTGNNSGFTAGECTQIVAGQVSFWGSSDFDTDCSSSGTSQIYAAQSIKIVE